MGKAIAASVSPVLLALDLIEPESKRVLIGGLDDLELHHKRLQNERNKDAVIRDKVSKVIMACDAHGLSRETDFMTTGTVKR